jgi:Lon protease-like protein
MTVLAMFPLGTVLLPGGVLPLHVFEPRYRAMVRDCLEGSREFGVVLIDRGHEVGGNDVRRPIGTVARMVQVAELADGRYGMITVGMRRIRVERWLEDDPYPRAEVVDWPDLADGTPVDVAQVTGRVRRLAALALELGDSTGDPSQDLADEPEMLSFQLATLAPLGDGDRYRLLSAPSTAQRFGLLSTLLDDAEAVLSFRLSDGGSSSGSPATW